MHTHMHARMHTHLSGRCSGIETNSISPASAPHRLQITGEDGEDTLCVQEEVYQKSSQVALSVNCTVSLNRGHLCIKDTF